MMAKREKAMACPFCGKLITGKRFCSTEHGPAVICDHCDSNGPPSEYPKAFVGVEKAADNRKALGRWNARALDSASYEKGIRAAAALVEMFDRRVDHEFLLSDCILAKFGLLPKKRIRSNRACPAFKRVGSKLIPCGRRRGHKKKHRSRERNLRGAGRVALHQYEWE